MIEPPEQAEASGAETESARSDDYEVGYGRPPRHTRFQPGRSGNPKGRPKHAKNLATLVREELETKIATREGGQIRYRSKAEVGVAQLVNRWAKTGDPRLLQVFEKHLLSQSAVEDGAASVGPVASDPEADAAMLDWYVASRTGKTSDDA